MPNDISIERFEWLVEGRSRNQKSTLDLYRIMREEEKKLNRNVELQSAAQEIACITFSLWRAVFLSDTTGEFEDQWADVKSFLISLISDNTVLYATDKNAWNWSFRYYLDNANLRMQRLMTQSPELLENVDVDQSADSDKAEWLNAQSALETMISQFERAVSDQA